MKEITKKIAVFISLIFLDSPFAMGNTLTAVCATPAGQRVDYFLHSSSSKNGVFLESNDTFSDAPLTFLWHQNDPNAFLTREQTKGARELLGAEPSRIELHLIHLDAADGQASFVGVDNSVPILFTLYIKSGIEIINDNSTWPESIGGGIRSKTFYSKCKISVIN